MRGELLHRQRLRQFGRALLPERLRRSHVQLAAEVEEAEGRDRTVRQGGRVHAVPLRSTQREGKKILL